MRKYTSKIPEWSSFQKLGHSKIIKSSYFWLFLIPVLAKFLERINDTSTITILGSDFALTLQLPFSWSMFYFSAIFFTVASILFEIKCPHWIGEYDSYSDWESKGNEANSLIKAYANFYDEKNNDWWPIDKSASNRNNFLEKYLGWCGDKNVINDQGDVNYELYNLNLSNEKIIAAFYFIKSVYDERNPISRISLILLYACGFVFFAIILVENFLYVFRQF